MEWWIHEARWHDVLISDEVVAELSLPGFPQREAALSMLRGLRMLEVSEEVLGLAEVLIREKVMPRPLAGDALHVAVATWHEVDYLLTWNVKHMANPNKRSHRVTVCARFSLMPPLIVTPDVLKGAGDV